MSAIRIEIVAIGEDKIYSVGAVEISENGDVYVVYKIKGAGDFHLSRHSSGERHQKFRDEYMKLEKGFSIKDFRGIEFLGTYGFSLKLLPKINKEYRMKKANGIFAIDMRNYAEAQFNITIAMLTEEGLPTLYESWKELEKRQIYIFTDCHPMIAMMVADAKVLDKKEG